MRCFLGVLLTSEVPPGDATDLRCLLEMPLTSEVPPGGVGERLAVQVPGEADAGGVGDCTPQNSLLTGAHTPAGRPGTEVKDVAARRGSHPAHTQAHRHCRSKQHKTDDNFGIRKP